MAPTIRTVGGANGTYAKIQDAIDASADGDTIQVAAGTFVEILKINKDVTILGANAGVSGNSARGTETVIQGAASFEVAGITMDGVTLKGGAALPGESVGAFLLANNAVLKNSILEGNGNGFVARPFVTASQLTGLEVSANKFVNWAQGAYVNPNTQIQIFSNQFLNNGNGVIIDSAGAQVSNNFFRGSLGSDIAFSASQLPSGTVDLSAIVTASNTFDASRAGKIGIFTDGSNIQQSFIGTAFDDSFYGDAAAQGVSYSYSAGAGDDRLFSSKGNDTFNGGSGSDTAVFQGPRGRYDFAISPNGTVTVTDTMRGGDGTDTLVNFEFVAFGGSSNAPVAISTLTGPPGGGADPGTPSNPTPTNPNPTPNNPNPTPNNPEPTPNEPGPFVPSSAADPTPTDGFNEAKAAASVATFFNGAAPNAAKQAELNAFANLQYEAYKAAGVANPALGPYEALGRGFAETLAFSDKYGALSEGAFIASAYVEVFGRGPTDAQQAHFQAQIDYFEALYEKAGISSAQADLFAKGAALGQMLGFAALSATGTAQATSSFAWDLSV